MSIPPRHLPEFRRQLVELYQSGRDLASLTREFGVPAWPIRRWARQAEREKAALDRGDSGLSQAERRELGSLTSPNDAAQADRVPADTQRQEFERASAPSLTISFPGSRAIPRADCPTCRSLWAPSTAASSAKCCRVGRCSARVNPVSGTRRICLGTDPRKPPLSRLTGLDGEHQRSEGATHLSTGARAAATISTR